MAPTGQLPLFCCRETMPSGLTRGTADVTTLVPVVHRLRERFGITRACVVADRGMISAETIAALEAADVDYILGARERSVKEIYEKVITDDGVPVPLTIPRQKGETQLAVKDVTIGGRRYIVCRNEEEAKKDAETRAQLLASLQTALASGDMKLVANTGYRRYLNKAQKRTKTFVIDPAKVEADAHPRLRRGKVRWSVRAACQNQADRASSRAQIPKSSLRGGHLQGRKGPAENQTDPRVKPEGNVYHKTDAAIRGHVFCTFLAPRVKHEGDVSMLCFATNSSLASRRANPR
jgi:hypothetical protein